jgi:hypothetical protein
MADRFQTHVFSYRHDGRDWELRIKAADADDARARIGKLAYATYDGIVVADMPVTLAPIGIAYLRVRNAAHRVLAAFKG